MYYAALACTWILAQGVRTLGYLSSYFLFSSHGYINAYFFVSGVQSLVLPTAVVCDLSAARYCCLPLTYMEQYMCSSCDCLGNDRLSRFITGTHGINTGSLYIHSTYTWTVDLCVQRNHGCARGSGTGDKTSEANAGPLRSVLSLGVEASMSA